MQDKVKWAIDRAKIFWGLLEWKITFSLEDVPHDGEIDYDLAEKTARMKLEITKSGDYNWLLWTIHHELGHIILEPVGRGASDWVDNLGLTDREKAIYEEQLNTRENEVIDYLVRNFGSKKFLKMVKRMEGEQGEQH